MDSDVEKPKDPTKGLGHAPPAIVCNVLRQSAPAEVIQLAMCSDRIRECARSVKPKLKAMRWKVVSPGYYLIFLHTLHEVDPQNQRTKLWFITKHDKSEEKRRFENNLQVDAWRYPKSILIKCGTTLKKTHDLFIKMSSFVMELFEFEEFHMETNIVSNIVNFHDKQFETFTIEKNFMSPEDLRIVMEGITVNDFSLDTEHFLSNAIRYQLKHRRMTIPKALFLAPESLMNLRCEFLSIGCQKPQWLDEQYAERNVPVMCSRDELLSFIQYWMSGGLTLMNGSEVGFFIDNVPETVADVRSKFGPGVQPVEPFSWYTIQRPDGDRMEVHPSNNIIKLKMSRTQQ